jgi:hypothetical protein
MKVECGWAVLNANVSDPVLVIPLPTEFFPPDPGDMVIDGWHRIARALDQGLDKLPAHFLTLADERKCRGQNEPWNGSSPFVPLSQVS